MVLALLTWGIFALTSLLIEDLGCCIKNRSCESADCFARAVFLIFGTFGCFDAPVHILHLLVDLGDLPGGGVHLLIDAFREL